MSEEFRYETLPRAKNESKIAEAAVQYIAGRREDSMSTISSKNQITLPVQLLRQIGLGAGDRLSVSVEGSKLVLRPRPRDWVAYHAGSLSGSYGSSKAEEDAYLRELRADLGRDQGIEEAWTGPESAPKR